MEKIMQKAMARGQAVLSEYDSKQVISSVEIPVNREKLACSRQEAVAIASEIGYPVALIGEQRAVNSLTSCV